MIGDIEPLCDTMAVASGPHSKVPLFLPSSSKCHCVRSNALGRCYIDILKTTEDLIFRLSLLLPAVLAEHIKPKTKDLSTQAAALCAAAGVFVTAWQQQQVEAGLEHPNGRLAHSVLIERIRNSDKYSLADIDEDGIENTSEYNKRTKALKKHFSSGPMKKCFSLMSAGGTVAQQPAEMNGKRFAARSLYGGIANTVGVSALHADLFVQTILEAGSAIPRRPRPPHPFIGLFAALRVSQRFKDCFSASRDMTLRSWYLMHIEGDSILRRIGRHKVAEEIAAATYNFGTSQSSDHFDTAFKTLMATVTTQWEDAGAFKSLVSYFPGGEAIKLAEVAPEDFETPADSATDTGLEFSPNLLN
ncbi:hypothetical protein ETH_00022715 [Eimeria tenella]|uniref:Uncharacterized protein n=1 Tax=Eimeria tenella TaxID=5802 RepID=U6KXD5_EIMTE|nr:hypothetical protein ETH_00022715 [Eimeria tenella]CDJ41593.1 hypothetical protein ETH_00022715 [Eimeria tenella]|eukprot:XP_013232343.1 hypothetical protein ETH_00022715 [Eimeria tenella]